MRTKAEIEVKLIEKRKLCSLKYKEYIDSLPVTSENVMQNLELFAEVRYLNGVIFAMEWCLSNQEIKPCRCPEKYQNPELT